MKTNDNANRLKTYKIKNHDSGKTYSVKAVSYTDAKMKYNEHILKDSLTMRKMIKDGWSSYTFKTGLRSDAFKQYLRDRGIYFESSQDGEYTHFEVKNADEAVDRRSNEIVRQLKDSITEDATLNYIENYKGVKIYQNSDNKKYRGTLYTNRFMPIVSFEEKDLESLKTKIDEARNKYIKKYGNLDSLTEDAEIAGWIAIYNGTRIEIKKGEADSLYAAKKLAILKFKEKFKYVKEHMITIAPGYNDSLTEDADKVMSTYKAKIILNVKNGDGYFYDRGLNRFPYKDFKFKGLLGDSIRIVFKSSDSKSKTFQNVKDFAYQNESNFLNTSKARIKKVEVEQITTGDSLTEDSIKSYKIKNHDSGQTFRVNAVSYTDAIKKYNEHILKDSITEDANESQYFEQAKQLRGKQLTQGRYAGYRIRRVTKSVTGKLWYEISDGLNDRTISHDEMLKGMNARNIDLFDSITEDATDEYTAEKYKGTEWGVFAKRSRAWVAFGTKEKMTELAKRLNESEKKQHQDSITEDASNIQISKSSKEFERVIREYHKKYGKILQVESMVYNFETGKYYMYNESTDYSFTSKRLSDSITEDADIAQNDIKSSYLPEDANADNIQYLGFNEKRKLSFYGYGDRYFVHYDLEGRTEEIDKATVQKILKKNILGEIDENDLINKEPQAEEIVSDSFTEDTTVADKLIGNGEVHFRYKGGRVITGAWNKNKLNEREISSILNKYNCKREQERWNDIVFSTRIGNEENLCKAFNEINPSYSVSELLSLHDSKERGDR